jgi:hypothetical protein
MVNKTVAKTHSKLTSLILIILFLIIINLSLTECNQMKKQNIKLATEKEKDNYQ